MSDSPSDISFKTSIESIASVVPGFNCPTKGRGSVRSKSLSDLNIDYPTESLSKSFHGLLKAPSFSELVAVQLPENPCIHDIYTINPGPVYHELPSLVKVESAPKMAESQNPTSFASSCECDKSGNIYCKFCDMAKGRSLIDEEDCQFDHFLPKASDRGSSRSSILIPDLKMFSEDAGIDRKFIQNISGSEKPNSEACTSSVKPKSLLETVMNLDVSYDLASPTKSEGLGVISFNTSGASSGITSPTFDVGFEAASDDSKFDHKDCDAGSVDDDHEEEYDATLMENLSLSDSVTEVTTQSDGDSPSPLPDTDEELVKHVPSEPGLADVKRDTENIDEVSCDVVGTDSRDDETNIQEDENVNSADTPELSESWVDLSKSNPPTPPHPHHMQRQRCDPAPDVPAAPLSTMSQGGVAVATSPACNLPPAQPHLTTSHSSGPFMIPHSMDSSMLVESSFLRHSETPMTSASLAEQYDSVGPLGFGNGEEYLRLLKEAQKDSSNQSSAIVSLASSRRDSPRGSPKSPPNSPNTELASDGRLEQLGAVYINYYSKETDNYVRVEKNSDTDWVWDWSSRPDQLPPKVWRFSHPGSTTSSCSGGTPVGKSTVDTITTSTARTASVPSGALRRGASLRRVKVGQSALFSRGVLYTLFITNVLSFLLGTGIGVWLSRRTGPQLSIATLSFN